MIALAVKLIVFLVPIFGLMSMCHGPAVEQEKIENVLLEKANEEAVQSIETCEVELIRAQNIIRICKCYCPEGYIVSDDPSGVPISE